MNICLNGHSVDERFSFCPQCGSAASHPTPTTQPPGSSNLEHCGACGMPRRAGGAFCESCGSAKPTQVNASNASNTTANPTSAWVTTPAYEERVVHKSSTVLPILVFSSVLAQFALTGVAGLHAGSMLMRWMGASQWTFNYRLLQFWHPFTWINPVGDLTGWRLRSEVVLLFAALAILIIILASKQRSKRFAWWCVLLVISSLSLLASLASVVQSLVLDVPRGNIYDVSKLAASNGGVTLPAALWLIAAILIVVLTAVGTRQARAGAIAR